MASDEIHISAIYNTSRTVQYSAERISQIRHQGSQGQTLAQFDYQHNRDGQRTQAKETIHSNGQTLQRTIDWSYDPAGKLTQEHITQTQPTAQTLSIAYQYDKVGNRTARTVTGAINQTTTYQYDTNDRLTQTSDSLEGTTSYRYDLKGNLVEKANGNNKTTYSWNSDSRLIKVEHSNSGTVTKTTTYGYDPQGRRIKKLVQQGATKIETHYSLDSERAYHEVAVESTRVNTQPWTHKTYVHTPGGVGELISQSEGTTTKQRVVDQFDSPDWKSAYRRAKGDAGFISAMSDFDAALINIVSNSSKIFFGVERSDKIKQFLSNQKNALLIYGPTPDKDTFWLSSKKIDVGKISLSKSQRQIKIEIGRASGQGGRMLGLGHTQGTGSGHLQWFRQDWHKPHGAKDERLVDPPYHYHW